MNSSHVDPPAESSHPVRERSLAASAAQEMYVLIVAGITTGVLVAGAGSRIAMLLLRLTSPDHVDGIQSDDDFTIGRFTLSGTYNLLLLGASVGVIGAATYQWVRPWLLGPRWFRFVTVALASGAVVGSLLVHADGIDFRLLKPTWFAIALFVALPALFAVCVGFAVELVERRADTTAPTKRRWVLPLVLVLLFPPVLLVLAVATVVVVPWVDVRDRPAVRRVIDATATGVIVRFAWLGVAVLGLVALVGDITDIRAVV